jgi:hypothetical protein
MYDQRVKLSHPKMYILTNVLKYLTIYNVYFDVCRSPLSVYIITRPLAESCANACFDKVDFCLRRFREVTKSVISYGTGIIEE